MIFIRLWSWMDVGWCMLIYPWEQNAGYLNQSLGIPPAPTTELHTPLLPTNCHCLIPNVLYNHNMVVSNSLQPLWHKFGWFLHNFTYSSCSCSSLLCFATWIILIQHSRLFLDQFKYGSVLSTTLHWNRSPNKTWHLSPLRFSGNIC